LEGTRTTFLDATQAMSRKLYLTSAQQCVWDGRVTAPHDTEYEECLGLLKSGAAEEKSGAAGFG